MLGHIHMSHTFTLVDPCLVVFELNMFMCWMVGVLHLLCEGVSEARSLLARSDPVLHFFHTLQHAAAHCNKLQVTGFAL